MKLLVLSSFVAVVLAVTCIADAQGMSKRFLIENFIPSFLRRQECILCKCYKECHASDYHLSETSICNEFWNSIKCSETNRCSCCNDIKIYPACQNGGHCKNRRHGNFTCQCNSGFHGQRCETAGTPSVVQTNDNCASSPCRHGGTCNNGANGYNCQCSIGWTGQNCEIDVDECSSNNPCRNGATCTNTQGHYSCGCTNGWTGPQCDIDVDECTQSPCTNGGTCVNKQGGYDCACADGLVKQNCDLGPIPACIHSCALETVVIAQPVESNGTDICPGTSNRATNEALLMQCCNIGRSNTWRKGLQVLSHCKDNSIPAYSPVASVVNGKMVPDTAGVFTTCLSDGSGFKMILQKCGADPELIKINGTDGNSPGNYFVMY